MRLTKPIETHGLFWLANKPDNRLSGVLSISDKGDVSLKVFGAFDSPRNRPSRQPIGQSLHILGVTDKTDAVTLVDCVVVEQTDVLNVDLLLSMCNLHVSLIFWGAHFDTEEIHFSVMTFSVEGLNEWFALYHRPFSLDGEPPRSMSITYKQPEPITFPISDDLDIGFHMRVGTKSSLFQEAITTEMSIEIESIEQRSFSEFLQLLRKVKNFLCLAFDRTVSFTSITGFRQEPDAPYTPHNSVSIFGRFDPYDLPKEDFSPGNFLISFDEMALNIQEYLPRWLENYEEYEPTFNLYFTVVANRYMHLEGGFLFLTNGIESLHRRSCTDTRMPTEEFDCLRDAILQNTPGKWRGLIVHRLKYANELSLRRRIREMITPFDDLFGSDSARKALIHQVVSTRNYLTHYDQSIKSQAVTDPQKLLQLRYKLEALVQLHLLHLLGIDPEHIKSMANRYPPLRRKLRIE